MSASDGLRGPPAAADRATPAVGAVPGKRPSLALDLGLGLPGHRVGTDQKFRCFQPVDFVAQLRSRLAFHHWRDRQTEKGQYCAIETQDIRVAQTSDVGSHL